jgi:hypothetical protein
MALRSPLRVVDDVADRESQASAGLGGDVDSEKGGNVKEGRSISAGAHE